MVRHTNVESSIIARRFRKIAPSIALATAVMGASLILWHVARERAPALQPPTASTYASGSPSASGGPANQDAAVAVVVGRNDTLDAIFRRLSLDLADLAAIRRLPGIRQNLDFLKPGETIALKRLTDGEVQELSRQVSETKTLDVVRNDAGFAATLIDVAVETRRHGGFGNAVVLTHGKGIATLYGHLSRFARNLRTGSSVTQGQTIGYVGMTGLATGPHLHYEYLMNGIHMNPQAVRLPGSAPLAAVAMAEFRRNAAPLLAALAAAPGAVATVAAVR